MAFLGTDHRAQRYRPVERYQAAIAGHGERKEVDVNDLTGPVDPLATHAGSVENAEIIGPKLMMWCFACSGEQSRRVAG